MKNLFRPNMLATTLFVLALAAFRYPTLQIRNQIFKQSSKQSTKRQNLVSLSVLGSKISHLHFNHLDWPSLKMLGWATCFIVPCGAGRLLRKHGFKQVEEIEKTV